MSTHLRHVVILLALVWLPACAVNPDRVDQRANDADNIEEERGLGAWEEHEIKPVRPSLGRYWY